MRCSTKPFKNTRIWCEFQGTFSTELPISHHCTFHAMSPVRTRLEGWHHCWCTNNSVFPVSNRSYYGKFGILTFRAVIPERGDPEKGAERKSCLRRRRREAGKPKMTLLYSQSIILGVIIASSWIPIL